MAPVSFTDPVEDEGTDVLPTPQLVGGYDLFLVRRRRIWRPPTDVYETDSHVVVKVEIAGMQEDDLNISFADRCLTITGIRKDPAGKLIYQNMEISYGAFRTEVRVDWPVERSMIEATYREGFLYVSLPKLPKRRIPIRTRQENDPEGQTTE
ncbi:MAG: Hsp20/alpha crystallin family protein [Chloroflexi bacterium]|jgi:HSP20 family molecular chaperone IbpA|nr:Hsp20/alpha crystallin family protein [Chloroflexota bacterium]